MKAALRSYETSIPIAWANRRSMYSALLSRGGIGVELGVERGDNAWDLLGIAQPSKLFLVDRWRRTHNAPLFVKRQEKRYGYVTERFARKTKSGRVTIFRESTDDAAHHFSKGSLDWIYIDANHVFAAVLLDIQHWAGKLKEGGVLMLHDFSLSVANGGVVEAALYELANSAVFVCLGKTGSRGEVPSVAYRHIPGGAQ